MKYVWASGSHVGKVRAGNEDTVYPESGGSAEGPVVTAVADGMGGHVAGEVASRVAMGAAVEREEADPAERVAAANSAVADLAVEQPDLLGMGTTMSLAELRPGGSVHIGHVGDSRIYLHRDGSLEQLTQDHTLVAALLEAGQISRAEMDSHPKRHYLTRAIGLDPTVQVDEMIVQLEAGDRLLLCSDGLTDMVPDDQIAALLSAAPAPEAAVWALIEAANDAGGVDNISAVVVDYGE